MKENYPQSQVWPYVSAGLLLLGLVLAPPTKWPQALRDIHDLRKAFVEKKHKTPADEPLIIAFDPRDQAAKFPSVSEPNDASEHKTPIYYGHAVPTALPAVSDDGTPPRREPAKATNTSPVESLAAVSSESAKYVWQPPPNWVPRPIQPFRESPNDVRVITQLPQYVPIESPVANRISRLDRSRIGADRIRGIKETPETIPTKSLSDQVRPKAMEPDEPNQNDHDQERANAAESQESAKLTHEIADAAMSAGSGPDRWPTSTKLHQMLADAYGDPVLAKWASEIRSTLDTIEGTRVSGEAQQLQALARLRQLATVEVDRSRWPLHHRTLHNRLKIAVLRRVSVWEPLLRVAKIEPSSFAKYRAHRELARVASQLESRLNSSEDASAWTNYLSLQQLQELPIREQQDSDDTAMSADDLVHSVLKRLLSSQLDASQQRFLSAPAFRDLEVSLRQAIAKSIHPSDVMETLESYEAESNRANANDVIELLMRWRSAPQNDMYQASIGAITTNYRNANLRVAVSQEMINRLVPAIHQYADNVNDEILGAQVRGRKSTLTNLSVQLIPDSNNIRLGLLANGKVQSNTASRKGAVTMFNQGQSTFSAGKELIIGQHGIHLTRTETRAATGNRVVGIQTELDNVPFLGWLVRSVARQQYADQKPFLRAEIRRRVQRSASEKIDREVQQRMANVEQRIDHRVMGPLRQMELEPKAMETRTTSDRVIMRTRLASSTQFGAHTPRPQARADSMMSFQFHQTAANNTIEQLNLQGRRMTLEELTAALTQKFGIQLEVQNEDYLDAIIQFADHHPLEFEFENGQIALTVHLAELDTGKRKWQNFSARGYYRPDVQKLDVELIRDEGVQLLSEDVRLRNQLALRSIFSKVLAKNTRLEVLAKAIQQQPRLQNLTVTQFIVRDGWIAVAFGENAGERLVEQSTEKRR